MSHPKLKVRGGSSPVSLSDCLFFGKRLFSPVYYRIIPVGYTPAQLARYDTLHGYAGDTEEECRRAGRGGIKKAGPSLARRPWSIYIMRREESGFYAVFRIAKTSILPRPSMSMVAGSGTIVSSANSHIVVISVL